MLHIGTQVLFVYAKYSATEEILDEWTLVLSEYDKDSAEESWILLLIILEWSGMLFYFLNIIFHNDVSYICC